MSRSSKRIAFQNTKTFLLELNLIYATNGNDIDAIMIDKLRRKHSIGSIPKQYLEKFVGRDVTDDLVREFRELRLNYQKECDRKRNERNRQMQLELERSKELPISASETVCYSLPSNLIENVRLVAKYEGKTQNKIVATALRQYFDNWNAIPQEIPTLIR